MDTRASLADVYATTRISLSQLPQPLFGGYLPVEVLVIGNLYQVRGETGLDRVDKVAKGLAELQARLKGKATYSLGFRGYRTEAAFLTCTFVGDGLGHFAIEIDISADDMRFRDRFLTDQTCLSLFIDELHKLGI